MIRIHDRSDSQETTRATISDISLELCSRRRGESFLFSGRAAESGAAFVIHIVFLVAVVVHVVDNPPPQPKNFLDLDAEKGPCSQNLCTRRKVEKGKNRFCSCIVVNGKKKFLLMRLSEIGGSTKFHIHTFF